jgi:hypothetical protein
VVSEPQATLGSDLWKEIKEGDPDLGDLGFRQRKVGFLLKLRIEGSGEVKDSIFDLIQFYKISVSSWLWGFWARWLQTRLKRLFHQ